MNYTNGLAKDEFLQHMFEEFPTVFNNTFSRTMLENIVNYGTADNFTHTKNELYCFLEDMIPEVEPSDLIPYIDKSCLTDEVLMQSASLRSTESLPSGWAWEEWDDGSGHLKSPSGKDFFCYDRAPYYNAGGIEYKETSNSSWDIFWGSLSDFKAHAESVVHEKFDILKTSSEKESLASRLVGYMKEFDPFGYADTLEIGETDEDAIKNIDEQLTDNTRRKFFAEDLRLFLDDMDPESEKTTELELLIEELEKGVSLEDKIKVAKQTIQNVREGIEAEVKHNTEIDR